MGGHFVPAGDGQDLGVSTKSSLAHYLYLIWLSNSAISHIISQHLNLNKMKNLKFITGMSCGIIVGLVLFAIVSLKPDPAVPLPQSSTRIGSISSSPGVYRLNVDNVQYVVVITSSGATAIVRHR